MKLYHNLDVQLSYQNFGSAWLCILRGPTEQIGLAFNGLFNLCATNGEMEFQDHLEMVATFWTDRRAMRRFFFNQYFMPRCMGNRGRGQGRLARMAMRHAWTKLDSMSGCHEQYLDFANQWMPETYGNGCISAERPDADMKDAILSNAFKEKETLANKAVDIAETV
jgi:hypothetical protein